MRPSPLAPWLLALVPMQPQLFGSGATGRLMAEVGEDQAGAAWTEPDCVRLAEWLERYGRKGEFLTSSLKKDCAELIDKVSSRTNARGNRGVEARTLLMTAAGWKLDEDDAPGVASQIRALAQAELETRLKPGRGDQFFDWLMQEVVPHPDRYSRSVRVVNLRALEVRLGMRAAGTPEVEQILVALMMSGRDRDALVRQTAIDILIDRTDDFVSDYFLGELERTQVAPETFLAHIAALKENSGRAFPDWWEKRGARLRTYVRTRLESESWRETSCALAISQLLETAEIVPFLIQGLGVWERRQGVPGRLRILSEYQTALGRLSGRKYSPKADVWARWWQAETADGSFPETPLAEAQATFFGLAPRSDRVLFIIDRSGSMRESWRGMKTRYEEAIDSLLYTLRDLGPETRFQVVLFSTQAVAFKNELASATPETLDELGRWARGLGIGGGTALQAGFEVAFPGLSTGALEPTDIPYDSVYILCDGETESPAWVAPWLLDHNVAARLRFHCVNIGGTPAGALEQLAEGSGGAFVVSQ